ncbi:MAG TPA: hypothetical protein VFT45_26110 [Longimicrobium sp.]|nr:hypothetical protein [Longimicrobium sp.]
MMRVIFDAGPQRWKIWFVLLICLICGGGMIFAGGNMLMNYGMQPEDGGVLKPLASRMLMGGVFALPGAALIAAILLYLQLYVTRIEEDDVGDGFRVTVAGFGSPQTLSLDDVARVSYNEGISHAGGMSVNAPWYSLRLRGRRFPLIVDMQGDFHDEPAVDRLIRGEPPLLIDRRPNRKPEGKRRR